MKILVAPDSFRDALPAWSVADAIARGLRRGLPLGEVRRLPLADGGEGTARVLREALGGVVRRRMVTGAGGGRRRSEFSLLAGGSVAIVEAAAVVGSGLYQQRRPSEYGTRGVGELLLAAQLAGARELYLSLGGTLTIDGGWGLLMALGYRGYDEQGCPVAANLAGLEGLKTLEAPSAPPLRGAKLTLLADALVPLGGPLGASWGFGPQKGLAINELPRVEDVLDRWGARLERLSGRSLRDRPGAGAAGGLGLAGLFLGGRLRSGAATVLEWTGFAEALAWADLVVTGEGRLDAGSARGKLVGEVARRARAAGKPVVALVGAVADGVTVPGLRAVITIGAGPTELAAARRRTAVDLQRTAADLGRLLALGYQTE